MKLGIVVLMALLCCFNVHAFSTFVENPFLPYPPGCVTDPHPRPTNPLGPMFPDNDVKFAEQQIMLSNADNPSEQLSATVAAYRLGCAEPDRSVILLVFSIPEGTDGTARYQEPRLRVHNGNDEYYAMGLAREQHNWNIYHYGRYELEVFGGVPEPGDGHNDSWGFFLVNKFSGHIFSDGLLMSASEYNEGFTLEVDGGDGDFEEPYLIEVPSTASVLSADDRLPLSGRLSGNWVVDGASDQGMLISISELVDESPPAPDELGWTPLLMFLSWYTYDADGDMLWLTGAAQFPIAASEVTVPIERVTNGEFMGDKTADREIVGSVTITGNNCNDLSFEYDLDDIGLGSGTKHLHRLFSLETAGYACRDLEARIQTR